MNFKNTIIIFKWCFQTSLLKITTYPTFCNEDPLEEKSKQLPDSPLGLFIILFSPQNQVYHDNVNFGFEQLNCGHMRC